MDAAAPPGAAEEDDGQPAVALIDDEEQQHEEGGGDGGLGRRSRRSKRRRREAQRPSLAPEEQTLRIRVSELACVVGLHPFQCIVEAVMNHVYQDLPDLMHADANAVGLVMVSREREVAALIKQAGPEGEQALRAAQRCARSHKLQSVGDVKQAQATIAAALDTVAKSNQLPQGGLERIESALRDSLFTGFGRRHEDAALAELERLCHAPIHSRNEKLWTWVFPADAAEVGADRPPRLERKRRAWSWGPDKKDEEDEEGEGAVAVVEVDDEEMDGGGTSEGKVDEKVALKGGGNGGLSEGMVKAAAAEAGGTQPQPPPLPPSRADPWRRGPQRHFVVMGSIDGMREEVSFGPEGEWQLASVIVEVKHRVREEALQKQQAPPFYEQLQLATYMLMLAGENGTEFDVRGELVEVVKTMRGQRKRRDHQQPPELESKAPVTPSGAPAAASTATAAAAEDRGGVEDETDPSPSPLPMAVTRITLDGSGGDGADGERGLDHRRLYYQHVVPALYRYVDFIYTLRCRDESVRRAFLAADEDERFAFIQRHLPFAYAQRARFSGIRRDDGPSKQEQVQPEAEPEQPEQEQKQVQPGPDSIAVAGVDGGAAAADGEAVTADGGPTVAAANMHVY